MGKTPAKKQKQAPDFQKAKARIGKKKLPASNATDTSFKTKVISMPAQSLTAKKGEYVTQRNLTLKDLLSQIKHYNKNSRKDAIFGLRDLINSFPHLLLQYMSSIFDALAPLIIDEEKSIRQSLLTLLSSVLPTIEESLLSPFVPLLVVYVSNAMTHMNTDIRHDALGVVNLLFEKFPQLMLHHSKQLLPNYVDLLGRPTSTASTSTASVSAPATPLPSTLQTASFATRFAAVSSLHKLMRALSGAAVRASGPLSEGTYRQSLFFSSANPTLGSESRLQLEPLSATLLPLLFGCWLECGPSDPSSQMHIQKLECMEVVLEVIDALLQLLETSSGVQRKIEFLSQYYRDMQRYFAVYFPFHAETVAAQRDKRILSLLGSLNVLICRLEANFLSHATDTPEWMSTLFEFIADALKGKREEMSAASLEMSRLPSLLPIVQKMLPLMHPSGHSLIFEAFAAFNDRCKPHSNSKKACTEFMSEVLLDRISRSFLSEQLQLDWLVTLCKLAWQHRTQTASTQNHEINTLIISTLGEFGRLSESAEHRRTFDELQTAAISLFCVPTPNGNVFGPFVKYPEPLQRLVLDFVFYFSTFSPALLRAMILAFRESVALSSICYWLELFEQRQAGGSPAVPLADYLGFLVTCATALPASADSGAPVLGAIWRTLYRLSGNGDQAMRLLEPVLLELFDATQSFLPVVLSVISALTRDNTITPPSSVTAKVPMHLTAALFATASDSPRSRELVFAASPLLSGLVLEKTVHSICSAAATPDSVVVSLLSLIQDATVRLQWSSSLAGVVRAWATSVRVAQVPSDRDLLAALDAELELAFPSEHAL